MKAILSTSRWKSSWVKLHVPVEEQVHLHVFAGVGRRHEDEPARVTQTPAAQVDAQVPVFDDGGVGDRVVTKAP